MLLKVYSLMILMLDLITLLFGVIISIIVTFYRTLRPPAMKNINGEVAMVILDFFFFYRSYIDLYISN